MQDRANQSQPTLVPLTRSRASQSQPESTRANQIQPIQTDPRAPHPQHFQEAPVIHHFRVDVIQLCHTHRSGFAHVRVVILRNVSRQSVRTCVAGACVCMCVSVCVPVCVYVCMQTVNLTIMATHT